MLVVVGLVLGFGAAPARADEVWARTGFGAFEPDLAERVLRGELRR